jgi:hypothetical protein
VGYRVRAAKGAEAGIEAVTSKIGKGPPGVACEVTGEVMIEGNRAWLVTDKIVLKK